MTCEICKIDTYNTFNTYYQDIIHKCQTCSRIFCHQHAELMQRIFGGEFIINNITTIVCLHCCTDEDFIRHLPDTCIFDIGRQRMYALALKELNLSHDGLVHKLKSSQINSIDKKRSIESFDEVDMIKSSPSKR